MLSKQGEVGAKHFLTHKSHPQSEGFFPHKMIGSVDVCSQREDKVESQVMLLSTEYVSLLMPSRLQVQCKIKFV